MKKRTPRVTDDSGMAMVLVMGSMVTLMVLVLAGLAYAMQSERFARHDQDYSSAMSAAQAGVDDYISRLNMDDRYHATVDCSNAALQGPTTTPNACGWGASTAIGWLAVSPGAQDSDSPHFHYSVDASKAMTDGTVLVTSTGRSKGVYRTVEAAVGKGGSTDFVYYTDFESADPANQISYPGGTTREDCGAFGNSRAKYFWQGRSGCSEITFIPNDKLDGRVFSNDAILSNRAQFDMGVESANPGCLNVTTTGQTWNNCLRRGSTGVFGKQPVYSSALYLNDNSAEFATFPGCHYYGATRIILNANGTMTVWSADSNFAGAEIAVPTPEGQLPDCGTGAALASPSGATVPVPHDQVVYVASAPDTDRRQIYGGEIGGPTNQRLPLGTYSASHEEPPRRAGSYTYDLTMADATKHKGEGNLYVQGVLKGRLTVAAEQSVIVTGDLVLADGKDGDDMLGLVATNSVEVMHPRMVTVSATLDWFNQWSWGAPGSAGEAGTGNYVAEGTWPKRYADPTTRTNNPLSGIQIAGSIQTLQHSFYVQHYNVGPKKGTLLVTGSIAQRWRGAVGTGTGTGMTGYEKLYTYDQRLKFSAPPYFPHWANSEWSSRYSGELPTTAGVKNG